jgi:signal transduction histidine kinase/ActR/RegA family two-component response regulator
MDEPGVMASGSLGVMAQPLSMRLGQLLVLTGVALTHLALDDLLNELLVRVRELLRVDTAGILLLDRSGEPALIARAASGLGDAVARGLRVPFGEGFAGRIAFEGRPVVVEDVEQAEIFDPLFREQGVRSLLGVPLLFDGSVVGVLHVGTLTPRRFREADVELLQLVGDRSALAIEHARLFESERAAHEQAEAASVRLGQLLALNGLVLTHLTLDDLLNELLVRVRELLRVDTAGILLLDDSGEPALTARAAKGLGEMVARGVRVPLGQGFAGRIAVERRPVVVEDVEQAHILDPLFREQGVRSLLGVPLLFEGSVVGVLHVGTLTPRSFEEADVELLQLVGDRAALAIENARFFESMRAAQLRTEVGKRVAERASDAKSEFLSHMSHELRTPLAAISGFAQLLQRDMPSEQHREWVQHILEGASHVLKLITALLDISSIEQGEVTLSIEPIRVGPAIEDVLALLRPIAAEHSIQLDYVPAPTSDPVVLADVLRLKQVLLNLVSNAINYNRPAGSVVVSAEETNEGPVRIAVSDTGLGIAANQLDKLFIPFERLGAEAGSVPGTGLGLVVTKGLVEAMGGKLAVESKPGDGSTFSIELTAVQQRLEQEPEQPDEKLAADPAIQGDVLYIEDNPVNLELARTVLAELRPGIELRTAAEGKLGVELAKSQRPDLVLLDLNLPNMTGEEVLSQLRARPDNAYIAVIVVSADSTSRNLTRLLQAGADAYLTKPFNLKHFLETVDAQLIRAETRKTTSTRPTGHTRG